MGGMRLRRGVSVGRVRKAVLIDYVEKCFSGNKMI